MKETILPPVPDAKSPAGADIRFVIDGPTGNMIHSTVPAGQINWASVHATVNEFWHLFSGTGETWRRDGVAERITELAPGVSIDIAVGTSFQHRGTGEAPLSFLCVTMPPWPGDHEATYVDGA